MRFTSRLVLGLVLVGLALGLTACPGLNSLAYGIVGIDIDATNTDRCDDGMKVVVEGIQPEWEFGEALFSDNVRESGPNWVWIEPGQWGAIQWQVSLDSLAVKQPEGKEITVKAYCMRTSDDPGLSQRSIALADYIVQRGLPAYNVLEMDLYVRDSGSDPDYTVTPPGLTIDDYQ